MASWRLLASLLRSSIHRSPSKSPFSASSRAPSRFTSHSPSPAGFLLKWICGWKVWEQETAYHDYEFSTGVFLSTIFQVHLAPGSKFDFQKYNKRSLEDDFKVVMGVSPVLWASFVVFLLINVNGTRALFWASFIPLVIILAVGTKLQAILTKMALEITERHAVV